MDNTDRDEYRLQIIKKFILVINENKQMYYGQNKKLFNGTNILIGVDLEQIYDLLKSDQ